MKMLCQRTEIVGENSYYLCGLEQNIGGNHLQTPGCAGLKLY